jgi:hypothetical protein
MNLNLFKTKKESKIIGNYFEEIIYKSIIIGTYHKQVKLKDGIKFNESNWKEICREALKYNINIHIGSIVDFI